MATTKKQYDPNDFTNQAQAMDQADVDAQDSRSRLWQSMNYTYGSQRDEIAKNYDKAISQQDNAMLARGMQRSSYGAQIRSGLMNDSIEAQNDNYAAQIADYQNRIGQIEQQEKEDERWERQYADQRADQQWSQNFQQSQFDYQKEQADKQMAYQQGRDAIEDAFRNKQFDTQVNQWKQEFDYNQKSNDQKIAFDIITAALAAGKDADDATLARAGISRAEYNSMKKKTGGGGGRKKKTGDEDANKETGAEGGDAGFLNDIDSFGKGNTNTGATTGANTGTGNRAGSTYDWQNDYLINRQNKWDRNGGTLNR